MKHLEQVKDLAKKAFNSMKLSPESWSNFWIGFLEATYTNEHLKQQNQNEKIQH